MKIRNDQRWRTVVMSRSFKALFRPSAEARAWGRMAIVLIARLVLTRRALVAWCYRAVFQVEGRMLRHAAHHVLGDLRDFTFAATSAFDPDPLIMARRQGRRDVWLRISNYLNLDEEQVQLFMEIDDGIGG